MTIRASELSTFVFCERAWHYARVGAPYEHPAQIEWGTEWHAQVGRRARRSLIIMRLGILILLSGMIILLFDALLP